MELNPLERDTDDDGLIDGWEVQYQNIEYVSPLNESYKYTAGFRYRC